MSERGIYGKARVGADVYAQRESSSWGTWLFGGLVVGGAVLWGKHQTDQIEKLYATAGLPHQSFAEDLASRTKALAGGAREKIHSLTAAKKEA